MSKIDDGGPAFPTPAGHATITEYHPGYGEFHKIVEVCKTGMSLRAYAAIEAMKGLLAGYSHPHSTGSSPREVVEEAFGYADALIASLREADNAKPQTV